MALKKGERVRLREMFGGRCAYCGCELPAKGWHADHVEAVEREWWKNTKQWKENPIIYERGKDGRTMVGRRATEAEMKPGLMKPENDTHENLFPACRACNIDKSKMSLGAWREIVQKRVAVCRNNYSAFRHAERFGLVREIVKPVVFHFETYVPPAAPTCGDATSVEAARKSEEKSLARERGDTYQ